MSVDGRRWRKAANVALLLAMVTVLVVLLPLLTLAANNFALGQNAVMVEGQPDFTSSDAGGLGGSAANTLYQPSGVEVDASGNLWVADTQNHRVLRYDAPLSIGMSAALVLGQADFTSNTYNRGGSVAANTLNAPQDVALDASGNLWVADSGNHRVLRYDAPFTSGEDAALVLGQANFTSGNWAVAANRLRYPSGVVVESSGNLWVADTGSHRILRFDAPFSNGMSASIVLGQANFTSGSANRGGSVAANTVYSPRGVALDASGNLWVVDYSNHRVVRYDTPFTDGENAVRVLGQADFTTGSPGSAAANTVYSPAGVAIDGTGNLWVTMITYHRALKFLSSDAWDSYSDSGHTSQTDSFTDYGSQHTVYMYGTGFNPSTTYRVVFWDQEGATWYKHSTQDVASDSSGNLSVSHTFAEGTDTDGDWHVTVYNDTSYSPSDYDANDSKLLTDDQSYTGGYAFNVAVSAIPEFPTVMAAVSVAGISFGIYWWFRRRARVATS